MKRKRIICVLMAALLALSAGEIMHLNEIKAAKTTRTAMDGLIQAQGVWHRPNVTGVETDVAGICSVLDTFRKTGINLVFLETFYHGMTVYRSDLVEYYTGFEAYDYSPYPDYLTAFLGEAKKRGIEVHAWVEDFYVGVKENQFTKFFPQWMMQTKSGGIRQSEGADYGGYLFLDPANTQARAFLIRFYDELLTRFPDVAGLNLDYIRYPVSSQGDDTGFTEAAMEGFARQEGITFPENATREEKVAAVSEQYGAWVNYRAAQVTAFVGEVFAMVKEKHTGVLLSTAVFPEQGKSFGDKKQDFSTWLERGYLDIITPMAYYDDIPSLKRALEGMLPDLADCYCYAGISPTYHNLPDDRVLAQMQTALETGADGFVFFGSQSILGAPGYIELLEKNTPGQTLLPHSSSEKLFALTGEQLRRKLTAAGEKAENVAQLIQELDAIADLAEDSDPTGMEKTRKQLQLLTKYNAGAYVSEENRELAQQELELLYRWIGVKTTRLLKKTDGKPQPPKPTTAPTTKPATAPITQPTTVPTTGAVNTQPTTGSPEPTQPPAAPPSENKPARVAKAVGLGAAIAAITAAVAACFHAIRKGRKKG